MATIFLEVCRCLIQRQVTDASRGIVSLLCLPEKPVSCLLGTKKNRKCCP